MSIPAVFSIIEKPEDVLQTIFSLVNASREYRFKEVVFDHHLMIEADLAAEEILDFAAIEIIKEGKSRRRKIKFGGSYPANPNLKRFIRGIGIIRTLDVKHELLSKSEQQTLKIFKVHTKEKVGNITPWASSYKEQVVKDFVNHINACLEDHGRMLSPASRDLLCKYTGEIIDNIKEHAGFEDWTIVGYLDNEERSHMCEIAIFNFGRTIAETFSELDHGSYAYQQIAPYLQEHRRGSFFGKEWAEEDLLTLVALQGDVSSKNLSGEDTRGTGTVDLIEFFQKVHGECVQDGRRAKMAILSGSTHMLFDGTFQMKEDRHGRKVIAFNKDNDLTQKPERGYVRHLEDLHFPGTIISIRFPMQSSQTEKAGPQ